MLEAVLRHINNWFDRDAYGRFFHVESGVLFVSNGTLAGAGKWLEQNQYFRICGSKFNDGLHQHPATDLVTESFEGCAYALCVPPAVVELAEHIEQWETSNGDASHSPYKSESFGGYTYQLATDSNGGAGGWQSAFARELRKWRKL